MVNNNSRRPLMRSIDDEAILAATDELLFTQFVSKHKQFIINCAYRTTHKYITTSDDEWSIALVAFSNAVKSYDIHKGAFLPYSELIIKRNLIDYYRTTQKWALEMPVNPNVFGSDQDMEDNHEITVEITQKTSTQVDTRIKDEIEAVNAIFSDYGFSFFSLTTCSPKSLKTKESCKKAVLYILETPLIVGEMRCTKRLPIKIIQKNTNLPRKLLEHHRKYIVAAVIILSGDYPMLADYLSFIRKGGV